MPVELIIYCVVGSILAGIAYAFGVGFNDSEHLLVYIAIIFWPLLIVCLGIFIVFFVPILIPCVAFAYIVMCITRYLRKCVQK